MSKGYVDGPVAEEAERRREELLRPPADEPELRPAVFGCTEADPERHFLGWADEVDQDELFRTGQAWGLKIVRRRAGAA